MQQGVYADELDLLPEVDLVALEDAPEIEEAEELPLEAIVPLAPVRRSAVGIRVAVQRAAFKGGHLLDPADPPTAPRFGTRPSRA